MSGNIQEFDFSVNLLKAILWQYNEASNLQALLEDKADWYELNQTEFWENWITDVFDLRTANDFGLTVWSIILGQPIYTTFMPDTGKEAFGFGADRFNFDQGNFASDTGTTYRLPKESARLLLRLRYFQLTSSGTVPETNRMLQYLFGAAGNAYLVDNYDMTQGYVFDFALTADVSFILTNFDVLPRPAGVKSTITTGTAIPFGFGAFRSNFDNGNFRS